MRRPRSLEARLSGTASPGTRRVGFGLATLAAVAAVAAPFLIVHSTYDLNLFMQSATYGVATLGLVVLLGFAGQISLAQAAFFAVGAYALGLGTTNWHLGFWTALALGLAAAAIAGLALGLTTVRLGGHYLAMVTISFGVILDLVLVNYVSLTNGPDGVTGIPRPSLFGLSLQSPRAYLVFVLVVLFVVAAGIYLLRNSRLGRGMRAVRDNELAAEAVGVPAVALKVVAFVISSVLGALGGALYAAGFSYISPDAFTFDASAVFLTMVIIGGAASAAGGIFGTALLVVLPEVLRFLRGIYLVVYGAAVVLVMVFMPDGVFGMVYRAASRGGVAVDIPEAPPLSRLLTASSAPTSGEPLLEMLDVKKHFGGVRAVDGLDLVVRPGTVHALIGPNGSGKTTALNVISGIYSPTSGEVRFGGKNVTGWRPHRLAAEGLARTFQLIRLWESMTVFENVVVGAQTARRDKDGLDLGERSLAALGFVGLAPQATNWARQLSYGLQRKVEIARAVASGPRLLLLDEPAAGLNSKEKTDLVDLLRSLVAMGVTIVVIEHDMALIESVADRVTVLNFGRKIAEGAPSEVLNHPQVVAAYLGDAHVNATA